MKAKKKNIKSKQKKTLKTTVNRFQNKLDKLLANKSLKKEYQPKYRHLFKREWTISEINFLADKLLEWFKQEKNYWLKDFAITYDINNSDFQNIFCEKSQYFKAVFEHCKDIQESKLVHLGLKTRSSMPIFALKNVSKWRDKQEHDHRILDKDTAKKAIEELFE